MSPPSRLPEKRPRAKGVLMQEQFFQCPYCWEQISMVLDLSVQRQTMVEDCEVCCQPIQVIYAVADGELTAFDAQSLS